MPVVLSLMIKKENNAFLFRGLSLFGQFLHVPATERKFSFKTPNKKTTKKSSKPIKPFHQQHTVHTCTHLISPRTPCQSRVRYTIPSPALPICPPLCSAPLLVHYSIVSYQESECRQSRRSTSTTTTKSVAQLPTLLHFTFPAVQLLVSHFIAGSGKVYAQFVAFITKTFPLDLRFILN